MGSNDYNGIVEEDETDIDGGEGEEWKDVDEEEMQTQSTKRRKTSSAKGVTKPKTRVGRKAKADAAKARLEAVQVWDDYESVSDIEVETTVSGEHSIPESRTME